MSNVKLSEGLVHTVPADVKVAINVKKGTAELWQGLTPIGRNEFLCWIESAKQDKIRRRRISRTVEELTEGKKRPCCWVGCIHRTDKKPSKWQQKALIDNKK